MKKKVQFGKSYLGGEKVKKDNLCKLFVGGGGKK